MKLTFENIFKEAREFFLYIIHKSCLFFASDLLYNGAEQKEGKDDTQQPCEHSSSRFI